MSVRFVRKSVRTLSSWLLILPFALLALGAAAGWLMEPMPTTATPDAAVQAPPLLDASCLLVNPYFEPERAIACAMRDARPRPPLPLYSVGRRYEAPYSGFEIVVLAVNRTVDGVEVITFQWTKNSNAARPGDVGACRNDGGASLSSCDTWIVVIEANGGAR